MTGVDVLHMLKQAEAPDRDVSNLAQYVVDDGEPYVRPGLDGLVASSEKLLAMNRGLQEPDDRDSPQFKRIWNTHDLVRERIVRDAGSLRRQMMRRLAKMRSLKPIHAGYFDDYVRKQFVSNPLSSPLEEINPMHLLENSRRVTLMGPGGIGSEDAITEEAQSVNTGQFGFMDPVSGPECFDDQTQVWTDRGWVLWAEVADDERFAILDPEGRISYAEAERVIRQPYKGEMLKIENSTLRLCVTPNHRIIGGSEVSKSWDRWIIRPAAEWYGRTFSIPASHNPLKGDDTIQTFQLPEVEITNSKQRRFGKFDVGDWCEYLGWWLSEGGPDIGKRLSTAGNYYECAHADVTQSPEANPENWNMIHACMQRMGTLGPNKKQSKTFTCGAEQFVAYFKQWDRGCYDKHIPEEVFGYPEAARRRLLEALLRGDGRWTRNRMCYCSVSLRLAQSVERLAIELGYGAFIRIEPDRRPHAKTTNYVVSIRRSKNRSVQARTYVNSSGKPFGGCWSKVAYDGVVYCATVPGGRLLVRGKEKTTGVWTGNSSRAGIDTRMAWGAKMGSDGRVYQRFYDRRKNRYRWMSPQDMDGLVVGLPE